MDKKHKYIHFVDFTNPNVSLCDPYCVGLLKQHNQQKRSFFYDFSQQPDSGQYLGHPSILNRFYLEQDLSHTANYSLFNGKVLFEKSKFDSDFKDHFQAESRHMQFHVGPNEATGAARERGQEELFPADGHLRAGDLLHRLRALPAEVQLCAAVG